jgi:hypothetical protein
LRVIRSDRSSRSTASEAEPLSLSCYGALGLTR